MCAHLNSRACWLVGFFFALLTSANVAAAGEWLIQNTQWNTSGDYDYRVRVYRITMQGAVFSFDADYNYNGEVFHETLGWMHQWSVNDTVFYNPNPMAVYCVVERHWVYDEPDECHYVTTFYGDLQN